MNADDVSMLEAEWATISGAPFLFLLTVIAVAGIVWRLISWYYQGIISNKESAISSLNAIIQLLEKQSETRAEISTEPIASTPHTDGEKSPDYNPTWDKVDGFFLWQAAWLWVGKEPHPRIPPGSPAYPSLSLLKQAAMNGKLVTVIQVSGLGQAIDNATPITMKSMVTREELKKYARSQNEYPDFLQD